MTAGVDANMQAAAFAFGSQCFQHVDVGHRFTAGKRHAAAGLLVKNLISEQLLQRIVDGNSLPGDLPGVLQANIDAVATGLAVIPVSPSIGTDRLLGAMNVATAAVGTLFCII